MHWFAGVAVLIGIGASWQGVPVARAHSLTLSWPAGLLGQTSAVPLLVVAQQAERTDNHERYNSQGRRDPFEALVKEKEKLPTPDLPVGPVIDPTRPRGPLERFDLSALKLIGIVWGELGRRAMIRAPDGKGYFVTVGMYMGQNGGRIVAIGEDHLVLEELHRDQEGQIRNKSLTLPLRRKDNQQG